MLLFDNSQFSTTNPVNQVKAHERTSQRYQFCSTEAIVSDLKTAGFEVFKQRCGFVRKPDRQGFQKHEVWLRLPVHYTKEQLGLPGQHIVDGNRQAEPMLFLTNSHDGTSSVMLTGGFFRVICANGLVSCKEMIADRRVRHNTRDILEKVRTYAYEIAAQLKEQVKTIERMQSIALTPEQITTLTQDVARVVWPDGSVNHISLASVRRHEDRETDLWTVFNRIQENVTQGGISRTNQTTGNVRTTSAIRSIDRNLQVNQDIMQIAYNTMQRLAA